MLSRSLILLGLCAALGIAAPAFAEVAKPQKTSVVDTNDSTKKTTKKKVAKTEKGKKSAEPELTAEEKAKAKAKARAEAAEKLRQAKLEAMRAKAKADAEARRAAARAPKEEKDKPATTKLTAKLLPAKAEAPKVEKVGLPMTAERVAAQKAAQVGVEEVLRKGNHGELRSTTVAASRPSSGFFNILFGDEPVESQAMLLPETRALDSVLDKQKKFKVRPEFEPQVVPFSGYPAGTIVIDTDNHFLYLVEGLGKARRYGIAVGKDGLQFKGTVTVGDKQEWPRWIPTADMIKREPAKYARYKDGMPGGGQNPLGARAIYLYDGKKDTHLRIHGTIAPQTIGTNSSNGCFRMVNEHVIDLYNRVGVGTRVIVL